MCLIPISSDFFGFTTANPIWAPNLEELQARGGGTLSIARSNAILAVSHGEATHPMLHLTMVEACEELSEALPPWPRLACVPPIFHRLRGGRRRGVRHAPDSGEGHHGGRQRRPGCVVFQQH